jgi:hypothetical protein
MTKTKTKTKKVVGPTIGKKRKVVGPYVEPEFVRADQIGATPVHKKDKHREGLNPVLVAVADKMAAKRKDAGDRALTRLQNQRKCRIFDLMIDFTAMRNAALHGSRVQCQVIDDYKDHTDIIADRPGAPGVQFEWYVPNGDKGNLTLTILSEDWEFTNVGDGLAAVQSHIRDALETERKRNDVLRRLSHEERCLIGKGDWRDPMDDDSKIDEELDEGDLS